MRFEHAIGVPEHWLPVDNHGKLLVPAIPSRYTCGGAALTNSGSFRTGLVIC